MENTLGGFKTIVDKILITSLKTIEEHKKTNDKMMQKNLEAVNTVLEEKKYFEQKTKELTLFCDLLKEQREFFQKSLEASKSELQYMEQREKYLLLTATGGEDVLSKQDEEFYTKRQENLVSISKFLKDLTAAFSSNIKDWQVQYDQKRHQLIEMESCLRSMMVGEKTEKECQVNELELKWGVENVANLDVIQNEYFDNSVKLKGTGISFDSAFNKLKPNDNLEKLEIETEVDSKNKVDLQMNNRLTLK